MEGLPETESLWYMAQSRNHKHLLRHPTVTSFLWLKWQRIRKFFSRNIRLYILFVTCLTWYIFARFGGVVLNKATDSESAEVSSLMNCSDPGGGKVFCHHMTLDSGARSGFWYVVFVIEVVFLAFMAFRDLRRDCGCSSGNEVVISLLSSWFELMLACMAGFLIVFGSGGLWYILVILLGLLCAREVLQMAASIKRYFLSLEKHSRGGDVVPPLCPSILSRPRQDRLLMLNIKAYFISIPTSGLDRTGGSGGQTSKTGQVQCIRLDVAKGFKDFPFISSLVLSLPHRLCFGILHYAASGYSWFHTRSRSLCLL